MRTFFSLCLLVSLGLLASLAGCSMQPRQAMINDVAIPQAMDAGYRVVAVDGEPADRARDEIQTLAPYVVLEPGTHTLTLESSETKQRTAITAEVEPDKHYRIALEAGTPVLVEHGPAGQTRDR